MTPILERSTRPMHAAQPPRPERHALPRPTVSGDRALQLFARLRSALLVLLLRARYRGFVRDARPLATLLSDEIFSTLRQHGQDRLTFEIPGPGSPACIQAESESVRFDLPVAEALVARLYATGLRRVTLDARLDAPSIVESLLLLLFAAPARESSSMSDGPPAHPTRTSWRRSQLARAMRDGVGLITWFARLRVDASAGKADVEYRNEAFSGAYWIALWVRPCATRTRSREVLRISTRAGFLAFLILIIPLLFFSWHSVAGWVVWLVCSIAVSGGISLAVSTIGTTLYEREHRDALIRGYIRQVRALSAMSAAHPAPILKLDWCGAVLYANPAALAIARAADIPDDRIHDILPPGCLGLVDRVFTREVAVVANASVGGHAVRWTLTPLEHEEAILVTGMDLTAASSPANEEEWVRAA